MSEFPEKPAPADHPIATLIQRRWSPRALAERPVPDAELRTVLEAARWAASCFNDQPWRFVVTRRGEGDAHGKLVACLAEKNQLWAGHAPVLLLSVAQTYFRQSGKPNRHAVHDVGQASAQLSLQATELGLCAHQMAGFDAEQARAKFAIPADSEPVAVIALGYPGTLADLPEEFHGSETGARERLPLAEIAFDGKWGKPL